MKGRAWWLAVPVLLVVVAGSPCTAGTGDWTPGLDAPRCRPEDWSMRLGLLLGPQYYLEKKDQVQFSFGLEGRVRLAGPWSAGVITRVGVIADNTLTAAGTIRLRILRTCLLSLALDLRAGALVWLAGDEQGAAPLLGGGLELTHDLGDAFMIFVRATTGYVFRPSRGMMLDLVVGLGAQF